jgi:hypothetical protein
VSLEAYVALGFGILIVCIIAGIIFWRFPRKLKQDHFSSRWKQLQQRCPDESQWNLAIIEADDLLGEALKKKRFKGSSTGERLVDAQKNFTNNDAVWFGHKLRKEIDHKPEIALKKNDVQKALYGLGQGLKDIGAM